MFKQTIKNYMPKSVLGVRRIVLNRLGSLKEPFRLVKDTAIQCQRFAKYRSRPTSTQRGQLETQILFHTHQIEKGLSHDNFRPGFGKSVLKGMSVLLPYLQRFGDDAIQGFVYQQALSALHAYAGRHKTVGYDLSYMRSLFSDSLWQAIQNANPDMSGVLMIERDAKMNNRHLDFKTLSEHRYAIREYSDLPVTIDELNEAVDIAMKTPSVCNRQASRVYEIFDSETIRTLLDIQGGYRGYPTPPVLILVTSDIRAFMNHTERNEPFVDGGLYAMSLLYALEYSGLAACPLNAMFSRKQDKQTRKILDIPDYELPVMYIVVGHYPKHVNVCRSARYPARHITTIIK